MPLSLLDDDRPLAAPLLVEELDAAVDLGDDRRLLGPPGLEELGDARQAAGDVLRAADLARGLGQQGAGGDHLAVADLDAGPLGDVVVVEDLALGVLDDDLRVQVALVLDDRPPDVARGVDLDLHRLALDDVLEADLAADLGEDRDVVRVPLAEHRAAGDRAGRPRPSSSAPSGTSYFSSSRPLASRIWISPLRDRAIFLPSSLIDEVDADELDLAVALAP